MQFRHLLSLNSVRVNFAGLMVSALFSLSVQAAATAEKPAEAATAVAKPAEVVAVPAKTAEQIVATVCSACHGPDGNSVITANPKLAGQHPEYLVKQLTEFKSGKRANAVMSGMASSLSDDDMKNLAAYFSSQKLKLGAAKSNGKASLGEKIYRGGIAATNVPACAACHGATGSGLPKQFPRLGGQHAEYVTTQLKNFRTGERANAPMMMTIATKMTDAEMAAVADYVQGLR